ncbi:MAG: hypothetical protein ACQEQU_03505 [Spirochaetota bacterium]
MRTLKLHLYENIRYLCIAESQAFFDPEGALKTLYAHIASCGLSSGDEEIAVFSNQELVLSEKETSLFVGTGPAGPTDIPQGCPVFTKEIPAGTYQFLQLSDPSSEGIRSAAQFLLEKNEYKHNSPFSQEIILRGVKEAGFYVLQLLMPITA